MIALSEVSKTFRRQGQNFKALDRISLDIGDQEIYGIIGFSGAGKSTLVRCINLLEVPDAGSRVTVNGLELTSLAPRELRRARLDIGMIFQHFNLMPSRTVLENVLYPFIYKLRRGPLTGASRSSRRCRLNMSMAASFPSLAIPSRCLKPPVRTCLWGQCGTVPG